MFTIEHDFDATIVTLVDEPASYRQPDITIHAFEDCITVEQEDPHTERLMKVTLSPAQVRDLAAALDLPEGAYTVARPRR